MTTPTVVVQEPDSVPVGRALLIVALALLVGAGAVGISVLLGRGRPPERTVTGPALASTTMPEQTLIEQTARGARLREAQRSDLARYEWVDRDAGIVRIPIERAIDLQAEPER